MPPVVMPPPSRLGPRAAARPASPRRYRRRAGRGAACTGRRRRLLAGREAVIDDRDARRGSGRPPPARASTVVVRADHVDVGALGAALHRRAGTVTPCAGLEIEPDVDELARATARGRRWGRSAFSRTVPVVWSIWLSISASVPSPSAVLSSLAKAVDRRACPSPCAWLIAGRLSCGQGEDHARSAPAG